jgi:hypothetical protein
MSLYVTVRHLHVIDILAVPASTANDLLLQLAVCHCCEPWIMWLPCVTEFALWDAAQQIKVQQF